jgi:hypothetical protein
VPVLRPVASLGNIAGYYASEYVYPLANVSCLQIIHREPIWKQHVCVSAIVSVALFFVGYAVHAERDVFPTWSVLPFMHL